MTIVDELAALLPARREDKPASVLGAGTDDLEEGTEYLRKLAAGGWMVPTWPADCGGRAAATEEAAAIREALARFDAPDLYPWGVGLSLVGPTLLEVATPEQCRRWLPAIAAGDEIWCQLFSEPDAGSDLANLSTRAARVRDVWQVEGSKVWSSRAHYARWGFLLARTDVSVPKHAGVTAFALDMAGTGIDVRPMVQMNGDSHFSEVFIGGATVPDDCRIGDEGAGWGIAVAMLAHERAALGASGGGLGVDESSTRLIELARALGRSSDPLVRQRLAAVVTRERINRWTSLRARASLARGRGPGPEGSGAKLQTVALLKEVADCAVDLLGMAGVVGEGEWQTRFLTAPSLSIRGGTDEIQRNIVGERVLGLPTEPRVDKGIPFASVRRGVASPSAQGSAATEQ